MTNGKCLVNELFNDSGLQVKRSDKSLTISGGAEKLGFMCVIAGYIGNEQAAPVLIDMLRREEGLAGGYYTGLVTIHEGVLYHDKVVGDLDTLLSKTQVREFPGTIGLIHSRTPSGGGREWSHPFIDTHQKLAYIANGARGLYAGKEDYDAAAKVLWETGYRFNSAQKEQVGKYPVLPDGNCVHFSDILCQAIAYEYERGEAGERRLLDAAVKAYEDLPGGVVGLCMHVDRPDEIVGVRHNKPMEIGRLEDGSLVIASSAIAFPEGVVWDMRCPALSGIRIQRSGEITVTPFTREGLYPVGRFPSAEAIDGRVVERLRSLGKMTSHEFIDSAIPLWPQDVLNEKEIVTYNLMNALIAEGKVELSTERVPGVDGVGTAPRTVLHWKG